MKIVLNLIGLFLLCFIQAKASTQTIYMNVGDTRTLSFNAPPYIVGTQWTISDMNAVEFVSNPGAMATSATIKALSPRTAANRCIIHCTYYYRELNPTTGRYEYQRTGYQDWEIIITGSGSGENNDGTTVTFGVWNYSMTVGSSLNIMAHTSDNNYTGNYRWESDKPSICSVSNRGSLGTITALKEGIANIRVYLDNGNYDECEIVTKYSNDPNYTYTLNSDGESYTISALKSHKYSGDIKLPSTYNGRPITDIGEKAFSSIQTITSVTIPNTIKNVGTSAFYSCRLKSITIPNSVINIGTAAFCDNDFTEIVIPNSVIEIGDNAFEFCSNINAVSIGNSVTSIGKNAFSGCFELTSINIPNSVISIGDNAFSSCTGLTSLALGNSVESIGSCAFYRCRGLQSLTIPNSVTTIGYSAFSGCIGLTSVLIPASVTTIGDSPFYACSNLENIYVQDNNPAYSCDNGVLFDKQKTLLIQCPCAKKYSYTIPSSVTSIGGTAFSECSSLNSVAIPTSVISIGRSAFEGCNGLTNLTIPNSVTEIGSRAFWGCSNLESITVNIGNTNYCSDDGVLFDKQKNILIQYPSGKNGEYVIPSSVSIIGDGAFNGCKGITNITIPISVKTVGYRAFASCSSLASIDIPFSVTSLGAGCFSGCSGLNSVDIPKSVSKIGVYTFSNCTALKSVFIGESVNFIDIFAFSGCNDLSTIYSNNPNPPFVYLSAFSGVPQDAEIYIPMGCKATYEKAKGWTYFSNFIEKDFSTSIINNDNINNHFMDAYNMNGILIKRNVSWDDIYSFPHGFYIIGGKKIFIK